MFKLQRLEITGFKSFADYTEVIFTGSGITAVVGPNGCGKSNVSDCIAWVLGEQRAKSLRGEEMKDVIFQGTSKRAPGGMAEVVLHLVRDETVIDLEETELEDIDASLEEIDENSVDVDLLESAALPANGNGLRSGGEELAEPEADVAVGHALAAGAGTGAVSVPAAARTRRHWKPRSFALDFAPGESVAVARRLYRSGESEYVLNGKTCRLRDIQDLFAGTGLSGTHYALIEQGKIGQIISSKPSDRRTLIEEAAGISKFRTRQRAAETRLESAKSNLNRISDIVSEIDRHANGLRRQAAKTRRFKALREEFRTKFRQAMAAEGKYLGEQVEALEKELAGAAAGEKDILRQVADQDAGFRQATERAREAETDLSEIRARHSESALARDRNLRDRDHQAQQAAELEQRRKVLGSEIEATRDRRKLTGKEIDRLVREEEKESAAAAVAERALREAEDDYRGKLIEVEEIEAELERERENVLRHSTAVERLNEIERQLSSAIERLDERADGLAREAERAAETLAEHQNSAKELDRELTQERARLADLHAEKQQLLIETSGAREALLAADEALRSLRDEASRSRHRFETLQELEEKRAVYSPAVQKLFAEQKKIGVKLLGTLADRMHVDESAEAAIENLFGGYLQAVLVATTNDADKVAAYLEKNDVGRNAVLVVGPDAANGKSAANGIAASMGIPRDVEKVLRRIFPREMEARLIADRSEAKGHEGICVTRAGEVIVGGLLFIAGRKNDDVRNASLLAFKRELRELEASLEQFGGKIEKAADKEKTARAALAGHEDKLIDLQSFIVKVERELLAREIEEKTLFQEIERATRHQKIVAEEQRQIEADRADFTSRRDEARTSAEAAESARTEASDKLAEISGKLAEARSVADSGNTVFNEKRTLSATSAERRRAARNALRRVEEAAVDLDTRLAGQEREVSQIAERVKSLTELIAALDEKIASSADEEESEKLELEAARNRLEEARRESDAMSEELGLLNKQAAEARDARAALEIRRAETVTVLRNLDSKCSQELGIGLVDLSREEETTEDLDLEAVKERVEELRVRLDNFGAINMLALEELNEAEERLLFLTAQRQDIVDSIASAEEALREIKRRSRDKFREAFTAINENFREFFQELFGGGRGEMTLLEADDILEAGIEIIAQPPGKRLQNILLLSGGEKAMTAIALVLGIFKYRPSPFCLLDEVDAPLDDANVGRFVGKIAEMSEDTQFIVITHNKRTMEAARALYGVTMEEAGVSKLVSVRFE